MEKDLGVLINKSHSQEIGKNLLLLFGGGLLVVSALAFPGLGYALKILQPDRLGGYATGRINQSVKRLEDQKLIDIQEDGDKIKIVLLEKGKRKILAYKLEELSLRSGRWDHLWRIVIFDIPENKRIVRDFLRKKMKDMGFYLLQKSVLVTPWDCKDEIGFIKHLYGIEREVTLIVAKNFDQDQKVKKYFGLN